MASAGLRVSRAQNGQIVRLVLVGAEIERVSVSAARDSVAVRAYPVAAKAKRKRRRTKKSKRQKQRKRKRKEARCARRRAQLRWSCSMSFRNFRIVAWVSFPHEVRGAEGIGQR